MKTNKQDFIRKLDLLTPGLSEDKIIEQANCFIFQDGVIRTYNDELAIKLPVDNIGLNGAIPAKELYDLLNRIKADQIDVNITETEFQIQAGRASAGIVVDSVIRLPINKPGEPKTWKKIKPEFFEALKFCQFAVAKNLVRPILTCVNVKKDKVEASDNLRAVDYKIPKLPIDPFVLPAKLIPTILKYDITHIGLTNGWVHFKTTQGAFIACRTFNEQYPDMEGAKIFDPDKNYKEFELPKNLKEVVERALIFADDEMSNLITVEVKKKTMTIKSQSLTGWYKEGIRNKNESEDFTFHINPKLFLEILPKITTCKVGSTKIHFEHEKGMWRHVITLGFK